MSHWKETAMPKRRGWRLGLGIAMVVLGLLALFYLPAAGVASVALLGLALLVAGGVALFSLFSSDSLAETLVMIVLAGMLLITGATLLVDPLRWLGALTMLLGTYLFLSGLARIVIAAFNRRGNWGWGIVHGIINLVLSMLVWAGWPLSGVLVLGLFVGIELILIGATWIASARSMQTQAPAHSSRRHKSRST